MRTPHKAKKNHNKAFGIKYKIEIKKNKEEIRYQANFFF